MPFLIILLLSLSRPSPTTVVAADTARGCTFVTSTRSYTKCMPLPTQHASVAWTYHPENSTLELAFFGEFISPSGWVAWGINPVSAEMTGTRALVAFSDPVSGGLLILPFLLDPSVKFQKTPLASRPLDIPLLSSSAILHRGVGSLMTGATVEIHASLRLPYNKTTIHHVWNRGLYVQGYSPAIHPTAPADLASRATLDLLSSTVTNDFHTSPSMLRSAHGILNTISWGFLLPTGVATARYLRQWESVGPTWFYAHAAIQILGFLIGASGFGTGIVLGGFSPGITYGLHRGLGVAAVTAGSLQSLALVLRPSATHKYRKYWKSYHHFVGYGCAVVGVVNVFQGFGVVGTGGTYTVMGYCLALSTLLGVCMALEANSWMVFRRNRRAEEEGMKEVAVVCGGGVGGHSGGRPW